MPKASPMIRSFNAGEFSDLMEGRTDLDRYPASVRQMVNAIAAPQGPFISRSGTQFTTYVANNDQFSSIVPFIFSEEQSQLLEFANDRIRFVNEDGPLVYAAQTTTINATVPFTITSPLLAANEGDQIALSGYPSDYNLNGEIATVVSKAGDNYVLDLPWPTGKGNVTAAASRLYHVALTGFTEEMRRNLWVIQSVDAMYLLTGKRPKKLSRYGTYDWRLIDNAFEDGPYLPTNETPTKFTVSGTGNAIPSMTANSVPSGTCSGSGNHPALTYDSASDSNYDGERDTVTGRRIFYSLPASDYYKGFSANDNEFWASNAKQQGTLQYQAAAAFVADGYVIYASKFNEDAEYLAKDYAPSTWTFEASNNGSTWVVLDERIEFIAYANAKSVYFKLKDNEVAYSYYRIVITKLLRNGLIEARIRRLVVSSKTSRSLTLTANSTIGINRDLGFQATDVGRHVRMKAADNTWRWLIITGYTNATQVTVELQDEPFPSTKSVSEWRLGYWSDTTGWPVCGDFFDERLVLAGGVEYPDMFAMSVQYFYDVFSPTDETGQVLDESGSANRINSRRLSAIKWLESDEKGLLIGTGSGEYVITSARGDAERINPRNIQSRNSTQRGSSSVRPVKIDRQVLYVQRAGRTLREFAFAYEADGYKSPSMSQLASHLGEARFVEMDYAAEPHGIVWIRREDGTVVGMTYNRDENVVGWHRHNFSDGVVESSCVMPQAEQTQDALWMVVRRTINGATKRCIERLRPFWGFSDVRQDAWFVDCGLRYEGEATEIIYGLQHLEGEEVYGLADGIPVGPYTVENGSITLAFAAEKVVIGLGYETIVEIARLENGAADGTAIGKSKRVNNVSAMVWRSHGGEIGVRNQEILDENTGELGTVSFGPIQYPKRADHLENTALYTGEIGPSIPWPSNDKTGTITFKRTKADTLPFNVVAAMPQLNVQDR